MKTIKEESVIIRSGWFIHYHHDLWGGLYYHGPFNSKEEADEHLALAGEHLALAGNDGWDGIFIFYSPYIKYGDDYFALWAESAANWENHKDERAR